MAMGEVVAIVLAAGKASRWRASGGATPTKLTASWRGAPMVRRVAEAALASGARPVIVVTGHEGALVRGALAGLDLTFVDNPDAALGLSTSLRAGLAATPATAQGAVVLLGDMPQVTPALIDRLIEAIAARPAAAAVAPVVAGERGNPVLLSRGLFAAAMALSGDQGARRLLDAAGAAVVEIEAGSEARLDLDEWPAFAAAERRETGR